MDPKIIIWLKQYIPWFLFVIKMNFLYILLVGKNGGMPIPKLCFGAYYLFVLQQVFNICCWLGTGDRPAATVPTQPPPRALATTLDVRRLHPVRRPPRVPAGPLTPAPPTAVVATPPVAIPHLASCDLLPPSTNLPKVAYDSCRRAPAIAPLFSCFSGSWPHPRHPISRISNHYNPHLLLVLPLSSSTPSRLTDLQPLQSTSARAGQVVSIPISLILFLFFDAVEFMVM